MKSAGICRLGPWLPFVGPVYADVPRSIAAGGGSPDLGAAALQTLGALLLVIAVAALALWLTKRFTLHSNAAGGILKVIAGATVGQRERVVLVEVADTWLILGVAPGQVRILHSMTKPLGTTDSAKPAAGQRAVFQDWLRQIVNTHGGK